MGTVAEKLTYLNGTKSSLKTAINNLGGDIDNNTTFRQYANVLNDIYDNLPKVSDTGTNVSLSPTLKGRLGIVPKGNTYQESTTGKNLLNPFINHSAGYTTTKNGITYTLNKNGTITANGTATSDATLVLFGAWSGTTAYGTLDTTKTYKVSGGTLDGTKKVFIRTRTNGTYATYNDSSQNTITNQSELVYFAVNIVSGTTVNNYVFEPMIAIEGSDTSYEPYTGGQASPNPDYPQEIQSATGTQKVVVSGKNLFDKNNVVSVNNKILNDSGNEVSDSGGGYTKMYIPVKPNTQYTISGLPSSGTKRIYYFDNLKTFISRTSGFGTTYTTITTPGNCYYLDIQYTTSGNDFNTYMVCKGTSTEYQPYQEPQEVDIELSSRNLFDKTSNIIQNKYIGGDGTIQNEALNWYQEDYISVLSSTTYIMSSNTNNTVRVALYDKNKNFISRVYSAGNIQVSMTSETKYVRLSGYNNLNDNIQLEEGTTATDYTPYYNYSLNKIGDYEDYIGGTPDNWVLYKNIGKVVLNGSENWTNFFSTNGIYINSVIIQSLNNASSINCLSNYYTSTTRAYIRNNLASADNVCATNGGELIIANKSITSIADFKTWLSTHNTEVLYVLAETQQTPITDTNLISQLNELYYIQSYNDTTNIDVTGNLPMRITASAIKGA